VRLQANSAWNALTFILNGFVFVLIGLQLPSVLAGVREWKVSQVILYAVLFSVFLIVLRLLWTFPGVYVAYFIRSRLLRRDEKRPEAHQVFVIGWTGMRGVIALAAAMSLPQTIADGNPFPHRDLIVFLTFSVILVTLVLQGLSLPPLIRALGLAGTSAPKCQAQEARRLVLQEALEHLETLRRSGPADYTEAYNDLERHYQRRLASINGGRREQDTAAAENYFRYLDLSRALLVVERQAALRLRDEGRVTDEILRDIEYELDLSETRLTAANQHAEVLPAA